MHHILNTIIPVFTVIILGLLIRSTGYLPANLTGPLNRLVYYLAIPAMVFKAVSEASFRVYFNPVLLAGTLIAVVVVFAIALITGFVFSIARKERGTFIQSSFHGNLGYIGFAVVFYLLGKEGFKSASILAGFLMLLQNFLAVIGIQVFSRGGQGKHRFWFLIKKVTGNPIILSAIAGIAFSVLKIPLPVIVDRSLSIISGMALPLALLVIGASLSLNLIRSYLGLALGSGFLKLLVLPLTGLLIYRWFGLPPEQFLPGLIFLASPTATVTYVMASEMGGSPEQASAAVSMNTLISALTFVFWLGFFT